MPNIHNIIRNNLSILNTDKNIKIIFPSNSIITLYRRKKTCRKFFTFSFFPAKPKNGGSCIASYKKCKIYPITDKFKYKVTSGFCNVRGNLSCNNSNVIYLISCKSCEDQYIGLAIYFKARLRIHKSDIKTKKDGCGTAKYFNNKSSDIQNLHGFLQV